MSKMDLLDLYCKAGGASEGYRRAGFNVMGVDIGPPPNYPFPFIQSDALEFLAKYGHKFDAIHASPPCQAFSATRTLWNRIHPNLIGPTRDLLRKVGRPYIIENVMGAPLLNPVMLCGSMFGLRTKDGNQLRRHRLFEVWPEVLILTPPCQHDKGSVIGVHGGGQHPKRRRPATITVYGHSSGKRPGSDIPDFTVAARREAMGIDWMTRDELSQAIPPAYTEFLGRWLLRYWGLDRLTS
jgi:DNA (cytosine-5)-methyltransferase 1